MLPRERFEAALAGRVGDRLPAVFRLDKWYQARSRAGDLPAEIAGRSLKEVEAYLGLGRSARAGRVFHQRLRPPVERVESRIGNDLVTEYRTPAGTVRHVRRYQLGDEEAGLLPGAVEYPIKSEADYAVFEQVMAHTEFVPDFAGYESYTTEVGQAGYPLVILGPIPFHELLMHWTGYERGYMQLCDRPDAFLSAVEAGNRAYRPMWDIVAASPAKLVMHGVNFDTQMTSPPVFREHFLPYAKAFNDLMHRSGKRVAFHADGDMSGLLDLAVEAGYDVADCFACEPLVRCSMERARSVWRDRITIWGGVPSTLLEPSVPLERLGAHLEGIGRAVREGGRFILGLSDQAMPTSSWTHIALAARWARDFQLGSGEA